MFWECLVNLHLCSYSHAHLCWDGSWDHTCCIPIHHQQCTCIHSVLPANISSQQLLIVFLSFPWCFSSCYIHLGREFIRKQNNLEKEPCAYWQFSVQSPCTLFLFKTQGYSLETEQFHKCIIYIPSNYNYTNAMLGKSKQNTQNVAEISSLSLFMFFCESTRWAHLIKNTKSIFQQNGNLLWR